MASLALAVISGFMIGCGFAIWCCCGADDEFAQAGIWIHRGKAYKLTEIDPKKY